MDESNSPELPPDDPDAGLRDRLADAVAAEAVFEGWTRAALAAGARGLDLPAGEADSGRATICSGAVTPARSITAQRRGAIHPAQPKLIGSSCSQT